VRGVKHCRLVVDNCSHCRRLGGLPRQVVEEVVDDKEFVFPSVQLILCWDIC